MGSAKTCDATIGSAEKGTGNKRDIRKTAKMELGPRVVSRSSGD